MTILYRGHTYREADAPPLWVREEAEKFVAQELRRPQESPIIEQIMSSPEDYPGLEEQTGEAIPRQEEGESESSLFQRVVAYLKRHQRAFWMTYVDRWMEQEQESVDWAQEEAQDEAFTELAAEYEREFWGRYGLEPPSEDATYVFHVTSRESADSIMKHGFRLPAEGEFEGQGATAHKDGVWVSTNATASDRIVQQVERINTVNTFDEVRTEAGALGFSDVNGVDRSPEVTEAIQRARDRFGATPYAAKRAYMSIRDVAGEYGLLPDTDFLWHDLGDKLVGKDVVSILSLYTGRLTENPSERNPRGPSRRQLWQSPDAVEAGMLVENPADLKPLAILDPYDLDDMAREYPGRYEERQQNQYEQKEMAKPEVRQWYDEYKRVYGVVYKGQLYREAADPEVDRQYRDLAEEAYDKYVAFLKSTAATDWDDIDWDGPFGAYVSKGSTFFTADFSAIDSRYQDLQVNLGPYPEGNSGPSGVHQSSPILLKCQITIGAVPQSALADARRAPEQLALLADNIPKSIFVHEFIHHLDWMRREAPQQVKMEDVGAKAWRQRQEAELPWEERHQKYLSTPSEFNAWYQMAVRELERFLDELLEYFPDDAAEWLSTEQKFIDQSSALLAQDPLVPGKNPIWRVDLLDEKYRRKFLRRLHGFYKYYVDKIGGVPRQARTQRQAADPKVDRQYRQQAEKAWDDLMAYLDRAKSITLQEGEFMVWMSDVDPAYKDLILVISYAKGGSRGGFGRSSYGPGIKYGIVLHALKDDFYDRGFDLMLEDLPWAIEYRKPTFVHEFIHYLDEKRRTAPMLRDMTHEERAKRKQRRQEDPSLYFSTPEEFNAWYQALVSKTEEWLAEMVESFEKEWNPAYTVKHLLAPKFESFDKFLAFIHYVNDWEGIEWSMDKLDAKYQRKLQKRLYGLWQQLRKEYLG